MTPDTIEFLPARPGEPDTTMLLFALRGVTGALEALAIVNDDNREHIGDLAVAADCIAKMLTFRMTNAPARPVEDAGA